MKQILDAIYANDLADLKELIAMHRELNFKYVHPMTDLDNAVTPLTAASYLGRLEIVKTILDSKNINVNMPTASASILI